MKINEKKLGEVMLELGHRDNVLGTGYLQIGASLYERGISMTKELYPAIAKAANTTASRAERAMRHSITTAWERGDLNAQRRYFGYTVNPQTGVPTVGEYLARMAVICRED